MKKNYHSCLSIAMLVPLTLLLFFSCGLCRTAAAEKFDFNTMTDAQQRQLFAPQLVSGDDIRAGKIAQRKLNISQMMRGEDKTATAGGSSYDKRLATLEKRVYGGGVGNRTGMRPKAGIMFSAAIPRHPAIDAILPQVPQLLYQAGLVPVSTDRLQSVLNNFRYRSQLRDPLQISRFLAEYPGARYLFFLQSIVFPRSYPGRLDFTYCLADGIGGRMYPTATLERVVRSPGELTPALHSCLVEMANRAAGQARAVPWQGKVFLVQGRVAYISSGRYSGLVQGQRLQVNGSLRPVRDPRTGMVVGSVPGPPKAQLQVQRFFGDDLAETVIIAGMGVQIGDTVSLLPSVPR